MGLESDLVLCFSAYRFLKIIKILKSLKKAQIKNKKLLSKKKGKDKQEITDLMSQRYRDFLTL